MYRCPNCKSKFNYNDRVKTILDKNKILSCRRCGAKYSQSSLGVKISFYFSVTIYILFGNRLFLFLSKWFYNDFIREILKILLGILWIICCVYFSQFVSKFKKL